MALQTRSENKSMKNTKKKVLIIEDERFNINVVIDALKNEYKTFIALNGEEGLERARKNRPDIILLDIMMPGGIDGYEVCEILKADSATFDIPIIFLTAMSDVGYEKKGLDLGAVDYITKPVSPDIVRIRLKHHLELQQAKFEAVQAKEEAMQASRAKTEYLARMSHELRTPLNAIIGFSQIIARSNNLNEEDKSNLKVITSSSDHLLALINAVLDISKIESGLIALSPSDFSLFHMFDEVRDICRIRSERKGLNLRFEYGKSVPQFVRADVIRLRQVMVNLLTNAIKFTDEGEVTVRVKCNPGSGEKNSDIVNLQIDVEDTGCGITPDNLDLIFRPFVQDKAGIASGEGTGLGLAICRSIAQLMNGNITVESKRGQGSLFKFKIELIKVDNIEAQPVQVGQKVLGFSTNNREHLGQYRMLVVDDIESNRQVVVKLLTQFEFDVREACSGEEAINIWKELNTEGHPPELIWLDIQMPGLDGYTVAKEIKNMAREAGQSTAIVAISASVMDMDIKSIFAAGFDDYIGKPFKEQELFEKLNKHLGVEYIYEDIVESDRKFSIEEQQKLLGEMQGMESQWKNAMKAALEKCSPDEVCHLIDQIRSKHGDLADVLDLEISLFRFDNILKELENI
jgi:Amt family ammonium transporter